MLVRAGVSETAAAFGELPQELARRGAVLEAVRLAAERFLDPASSWEQALPGVLAALARATGVSRVYLFENHRREGDEVFGTQRFEWSAPGVRSLSGDPELVSIPWRAAGFGRWIDRFGRGEAVVGLRHDLPAPEQRRLAEDDTLSIAVVPITVQGAWWGILGFDETTFERVWTAGDIDGLRAAASTIAAAIHADRARADLLVREAEYRAVFEARGDGLVISDLEGSVVSANPAFCEMHGYRCDEVIGRPAITFVHPDFHAARERHRAAMLGGRSFTGQVVTRRSDGSDIDVEINETIVDFRGAPHALAVVRDVTERVRIRRLLEQRVQALSRVASVLTADQPLDETLRLVCAVVCESTGAVAASVQRRLPDGTPEILGYHNLDPDYVAGLLRVAHHADPLPNFQAFLQQETRWVPDAKDTALSLPGYAPVHDLLRPAPWRGVLTVPLDEQGRHLGVVNTYYTPDREPSDEERAFVRAVADLAAAAVENDRLFGAARGAAALQERQRLARELHDSVSQALYGIALGARTARTLAERDLQQVIEPIDYVLGLAEAGLEEMRALIFELRPEALASEGLVAALDRQLRALRARHGLEVDSDLGDEPDVDLAVKEVLYRIAQEALHNVVKHARATAVGCVLMRSDVALELTVTDDGIGFDPSGEFRGHLGLQSMRERAAGISGELTVDSEPGGGTRIRVRAPVVGERATERLSV